MSARTLSRRTKIVLSCLQIVAIVCALFALFQLYTNGKTDRFGSGSVRVAECTAVDEDWKIYTCRGDYHSSAGMIGIADVTVRVTGRSYTTGQLVDYVYPLNIDSKHVEDARYFITGTERSSVRHNAGWLVLLFVAVFVSLGGLGYALLVRSRFYKPRES